MRPSFTLTFSYSSGCMGYGQPRRPSATEGALMRYVRILLAGSIVWAAPAFSQTDGNSDCTSGDPDRMLTGCTSIIAGRVLQRKVSIASAYMNRGNAYDEKGDHDRAIADYTEAIRFNHRFVEAYDNRGFTYYLKGNYDRAIADYDEAIRLKPNNVFAYRNRGMA